MVASLCGGGACACGLTVVDSTDGVIDLTLTGSGAPGDPWLVTPRFDNDAFNAETQLGDGLTGYILPAEAGSPSVAALAVRTSGVWGASPLDVYGGTSTVGAPIYVDSNGEIRTVPTHTANVAGASGSWGSTLVPTQTANAVSLSGNLASLVVNNLSAVRTAAIIMQGYLTFTTNTAVAGAGIEFQAATELLVNGAFAGVGGSHHVNVTPATPFLSGDGNVRTATIAAGGSVTFAVRARVTWRSGTWTSLVLTGSYEFAGIWATT